MSMKKQRTISDSSSTDDLSSETEGEVSSEEEMNLRWPRSDDGGTSDSENNDSDTSDDGDTSHDAFD
jgi:hypothetical protein